MSMILSLPGRGSTSFYFTRIGNDGFSERQQEYIAGLIREYRERFLRLEINGVWDFGIEEGAPYAGEKYGDFAACRDNAVFNGATLSISYNHIRVSRMPDDLSGEELNRILRMHSMIGRISEAAVKTIADARNRGEATEQIRESVRMMEREIMEAEEPGSGVQEIGPGPHNGLALDDPFFADVWAVRQLEESMSIRRLTLHELGHALADAYGMLKDKKVKKLFAQCGDGFESRDEFCAECFMASEMTRRIPLSNAYAAILAEKIAGK